jgi:PAS domain S-box-containing protein
MTDRVTGPSSGPPATPRHRQAIPWHRGMRVQVALGVSVLVALSLGAALLATTRVVTRRSMSLASENMEAARSAFYHLADSRAEFAAAQTRLITALPVFRAYMTDSRLASDAATLGAMADHYRLQLEAQFCILTDRTGLWTASPGWAAGQIPPAAMRSTIDGAVKGGARHDIVSIDNKLFLIVSEPARFAEEILGTLTVGYELNDAVAQELAEVTHCEVNLVAGDYVSGSSLDPTKRALLGARLAGRHFENHRGVSVAVERLSNVEYVTGVYPLFRDRAPDGRGGLILLQDWRPTQLFLDELRGDFLRGGLVIFAFALGGGFIFSERVTRPLKDIAEAAGEMADGNWAHQVPIRGSAEATTMATAFNAMGTNLCHWYEEAKDKSERLLVSYERFRSVTESARDAIVSADDRGAITFWNRSAGTIFGYSEAEALGGAFTRLIAEPHRQGYLDLVTVLGSGTDRSTPGWTIELTAVRKDGSEFPAEFSLSAWQSGEATSLTAVARDITARKRAEAQARRHDQEVQSQRLKTFRATMTTVHDIVNNFLASMQLIRLEAEGRLSEETLTLFDRLIQEAATELKVLGDLQTIREKEMVIGRGIEYQSSQTS